jgi:hypothetical protein
MPSFKSKKEHSKQSFLTHYLLRFLFSAGAILVLRYFDLLSKNSTTIILLIPLLIILVEFSNRSRQILINEIDINLSNKIITFYFFHFWRGHTIRTESLDTIKYLIDKNYSEGLLKGSTPAVFFFKEKPGDFYVSELKDEFPEKAITELSATLQEITRPSIA